MARGKGKHRKRDHEELEEESFKEYKKPRATDAFGNVCTLPFFLTRLPAPFFPLKKEPFIFSSLFESCICMRVSGSFDPFRTIFGVHVKIEPDSVVFALRTLKQSK